MLQNMKLGIPHLQHKYETWTKNKNLHKSKEGWTPIQDTANMRPSC